ncbi:DEP domain-containing protein 7-like [Xyrichtys novacula]|uniref:DEP domain-containing protein 7 n=1 Tax=Xyrichtys novacula TaxID=13765 RepID=A0AAV1GDW9_XYRNO|nr:DEP domain-containing protein 7-like [Xyrichtys novacula]
MASVKEKAAMLNLAGKSCERPKAHGEPREPVQSSSTWSGLISHLRSSVTLKRQRVHLKFYRDCFLGSEAADVIEEHINHVHGLQGACAPREEAVTVCQALLDCNMFEKVGAEVFGKDKKRTVFQDSKRAVYRFTEVCNQSVSDLEKSYPVDELQKHLCRTLSERQEVKTFSDTRSHVQTLIKAHQLDTPASANLSGKPPVDTLKQSPGKIETETVYPQSLVEGIWQEQTLQRLLNLVELPILEGVLQCCQAPSSPPSTPLTHNNTDLIYSSNHLDRQILKAFKETQEDEWLCAALDCLAFLPDQPVVELSRELSHCFAVDHDSCEQMPADSTFQERANDGEELPPPSTGDLTQYKLLLYSTLVSHYSHRPPLLPEHMADVYTAIADLLVKFKMVVALEALQLCLKLLPAACRDELRKLLTFAALAGDPQGIKLDKQVENRLAVKRSFCRAILHSKALSKETEDLIVVFMLSNEKDIFKIPGALHREVSDQLASLGKLPKLSGPLTCQQVSIKNDSDTKKNNTNQELCALLKSIHQDTKISAKKRKHLLAQFYQAHPSIFNQYFGESAATLL